MKSVKTYKQLGRQSEVTYTSDTFNGEYLDTAVDISGYVCCIEGSKISEFHEKLEALIEEYAI